MKTTFDGEPLWKWVLMFFLFFGSGMAFAWVLKEV